MSNPQRILVIKLSALGDFVQAFGPFSAIRSAYPDAHITLLTTAPYVDLVVRSPWFDTVWVDTRPKMWQISELASLSRRLRSGHFDRVYDLQTSRRSSSYFWLMGGPKAVEWSGIAAGCSHPHRNSQRDAMHTLERQAEQLRDAGLSIAPIRDFWQLDTLWLAEGVPSCALGMSLESVVLLVPGGAPHRPEKRWPAHRYAELAQRACQAGYTPVILGTASEQKESAFIQQQCPQAISLVGQTAIADVARLGARVACAVGNDTGPMHLLASVGCRSVVLYSFASCPALCGQRGPAVALLQQAKIEDIIVDEVIDNFQRLGCTFPALPDLSRFVS